MSSFSIQIIIINNNNKQKKNVIDISCVHTNGKYTKRHEHSQ